MKSPVTLLLLSCFIAIGTGTTISHGQEKVPKSFLSVLNVGQSVSLKDVGDKGGKSIRPTDHHAVLDHPQVF